jgi:cytochrome c oxidase assembly protein subunit 15
MSAAFLGEASTSVQGRGESAVRVRAIRFWLYAIAALVLAMVLVGGATRLTESGLSITEWRPVMGVLPPLDAAQWQSEFDKYRAIPQFRELNADMNLDAFKTIYRWEWTHRLIGRLIGIAFALPLVWFWWRGWLEPRLRARLLLIFGLGALQGAVGWWMVASGLVERVEVSQYRLAAHLILACLIYVALIWTARRLDEPLGGPVPNRIRFGAASLLGLVLAQIYFGALVAGLRAGYVYNTWPLIDGSLVPEASRLSVETPLWRNIFENTLTVQFDHRMLAYAIWLCALVHAIDVAGYFRKGRELTTAVLLVAAVTLQAMLGIATLLMRAPLSLALAHQAGAMLVLTIAALHAAALAGRIPKTIASRRSQNRGIPHFKAAPGLTPSAQPGTTD